MIDLHVHSTFSDGTDSPEALAYLAKDANLSAFALTDHDCLDGIELARSEAKKLGIEFVAGVEVSCQHPVYNNKSCHVLIYFVEQGSEPIGQVLQNLREDRKQRNQKMLERLNRLGVDLSMQEVAKFAGGQELARPHFAKAMVEKKIVKNVNEAFEKYLSDNAPAYVKKAHITLKEIAKIAKDSKGLAVLAHPLRLNLKTNELVNLFKELKDYGFVGAECYYGDYSLEDRNLLLEITKRARLIPTGGSDYHGNNKEGLRLGIGRGDLCVPDEVLDALKAFKALLK
jgi:predicted metal-dependent phosphoesterase TrpH